MAVEIVIEYCAAWNYEPQAVGLAENILKLKHQVASLRLIPSRGGVFEVTANGRTIYSKKATGQFPEPDTVLQKLRGMV